LSSILTALKKLEGESTYRTDSQFQSWKLDTKKALHRGTRESWRFFRLISIFFIALISIAGGWIFIDQQSRFINKPSEWIVPVKSNPTPAKMQTKEVSLVLPKQVSSTKSMNHPDKAPTPLILQAVKKSVEAELNLFEPFATDGTDHEKRSQPLLGEWTDESRLKLQAIAWSNNPEKRIAVINDHIIREGSSIDGVHVMHIKEDEVVIREGTDSFKLVFKLK